MRIFLVLTMTCAMIADALLPNLRLQSILEALNTTCFVIVIENGSIGDGDGLFLDLATTLEEAAFADDPDVIFGRSTRSELTSNLRVKIRSLDQNSASGILVLERRPPDRSCLLSDQLVTNKDLKSHFYDRSHRRLDTEHVLRFINEACGTFKTVRGDLDEKGRRREEILDSLYSRNDGPTMRTIRDECADRHGRLKEYFYAGKCGDGDSRRFDLPRCETVDASELTEDEFFRKYLARSKPVILKNVLSTVWPDRNRWTNDFFRRNFGDRRVHIKLTPTGEFEGVENANLWSKCRRNQDEQVCVSPLADIPIEVRRHLRYSQHLVLVRPAGVDMSMNEFVDIVENRSRWMNYSGDLSAYLEYTPVGEHFVGFKDQLPELPFAKNLLKLDLLNMWLSNGNTLGKLHFDQYDNFLCQISGKKRLILFHPYNNSRMYEGHIVEAELAFEDGGFVRNGIMENTALTMAPVDIEKPDFETFPEFAHVIPLNCTIEAGDVLFMPSFWWHEVQSYPDPVEMRNLAFNFWYEPFLQKEFPCVECRLDVNRIYRHLL